MSDFSLDSSSLIGALKAQIARTVSELDAIIAKLEDMKHDLADPLIEAQRLAAKRFKHDAHLRHLSEKSETAKKALDNLMLQTVESSHQCWRKQFGSATPSSGKLGRQRLALSCNA
jgi:hypothetical protein